MWQKLPLHTLEKGIKKRILFITSHKVIGGLCQKLGKTTLSGVVLAIIGCIFTIYLMTTLINPSTKLKSSNSFQNELSRNGTDGEKLACRAAEIKGKYKTIACDDELFDVIYQNLNSSDEDRRLSRDRSTILEYSSNGKGSYTVQITSDTLPIPKAKVFRLDVPMQRISGDQRYPEKSSYVITYTCVGDDLVKTKKYPNGKVWTQQRIVNDDEAKIVEVLYKVDGITARRVLQKIE